MQSVFLVNEYDILVVKSIFAHCCNEEKIELSVFHVWICSLMYTVYVYQSHSICEASLSSHSEYILSLSELRNMTDTANNRFNIYT